MNLLILHLYFSAHTTSQLLYCYLKTEPMPRTFGFLRTSEGRTPDHFGNPEHYTRDIQSHRTRTSGSLRTSEGRTSDLLRKSGTYHQKKLSCITRISGPLRTSGRCLIQNSFSRIYRPRTTDPCRTSDPSRTPGLPATVGRPDPV